MTSARKDGPWVDGGVLWLYAGTKLGIVLIVARLSALTLEPEFGPDLNWRVLLELSLHRVNKMESEWRRAAGLPDA